METAKNVLDNYQVRKTKKQKNEFIGFVEKYSAENGYSCRTEKAVFGARNIIVGDPERAKVVYTAHYDTCPVLPFPNFITPKKISIYLLYQIVIALGFFVVYPIIVLALFGAAFFAVNVLHVSNAIFIPFYTGTLESVVLIVMFMLFFFGPANKHTANDNTSGVVTLLEIMRRMPEDKRENAAFIFFDLEEMGLFGSSGYASKHKSQKKNKLLVNFDCVSNGDNILFVLRKGAKNDRALLEKYYESNGEFKVEILDKGVFYPSDQAQFSRGVGVAALKYSKFFKTLYMDKIHTKNDTVFEEKNIEYLAARATQMASEME